MPTIQGPGGPIEFPYGPEGEEAARQYRRALALETDPQLSDPGQNELYGGTLPGGNLPWEHMRQLIAGLFGGGQLPRGPVGEQYYDPGLIGGQDPNIPIEPRGNIQADAVGGVDTPSGGPTVPNVEQMQGSDPALDLGTPHSPALPTNGEGREVASTGANLAGVIPTNENIDTGWGNMGLDDLGTPGPQEWTVPRPSVTYGMGKPPPPQPDITVETLPDIESASPEAEAQQRGVLQWLEEARKVPSGTPMQRPQMLRDALEAAKRRMKPDSGYYK